jgi:hypothetical protein
MGGDLYSPVVVVKRGGGRWKKGDSEGDPGI